MRISQDTVDQIRDAVDIVDVVGDFVSLKKKGGNWWALSPFANEKLLRFRFPRQKASSSALARARGAMPLLL